MCVMVHENSFLYCMGSGSLWQSLLPRIGHQRFKVFQGYTHPCLQLKDYFAPAVNISKIIHGFGYLFCLMCGLILTAFRVICTELITWFFYCNPQHRSPTHHPAVFYKLCHSVLKMVKSRLPMFIETTKFYKVLGTFGLHGCEILQKRQETADWNTWYVIMGLLPHHNSALNDGSLGAPWRHFTCIQ